MAAKNRGTPTLTERLLGTPGRFRFHQLLRLLSRICLRRPTVGTDFPEARPWQPFRFRSKPGLAHPESTVTKVQVQETDVGTAAVVTTSLTGLTGPLSVLPEFYTRLAIERGRSGDHAFTAFLDLFQDRLIRLLFTAWKKYFPPAALEDAATEGSREPLTESLLALSGVSGADRRRLGFSHLHLAFFSGIWADRQRSAAGLEKMVSATFGIPVTIRHFTAMWLYPEESDCTKIGTAPEMEANAVLGRTFIIGTRIRDFRSRCTLALGPLTQEQFLEFLPGQKKTKVLAAICQFYAGPSMGFDLELRLQQDFSGWTLGSDGHTGKLGWTCWLNHRFSANSLRIIRFSLCL
jgi:type VI secretion system protein ImpH